MKTGTRGQLVMVFGGAMGSDEPDTLELSLLDADHAQLLYVGLPFEPWVLTRSLGADETPIPWNVGGTYTLDTSSESPNPEMASIYAADQEGRASARSDADWIQVERDDVARRRRTRALLDAGQIKAGIDFERAAVVFQHGGTPDDHLLAHTLALVALAKRQTSARWIATASLDAYLQAVGQPQIFGTRFTGEGDSSKVSEPFNRGLVSDELRRALNVPALADQEAQFRAAIRR